MEKVNKMIGGQNGNINKEIKKRNQKNSGAEKYNYWNEKIY